MKRLLAATPIVALFIGVFAWLPSLAAQQRPDPKQLVGKDSPALKLAGLDDKEVNLADLKGSVVVIDFWATWCPPCRASLPSLNQLQKDLGKDGLRVLAVNIREKNNAVSDFVKKNSLEFTVLMDVDGAVAKAYLVSGIPQTVVVGKDGKVTKVFVGFGGKASEDALRAAVDEALKAK